MASDDAVTILDGDEEITVYTDELLVSDIISQSNIEISDSDVVYPAINSQIDGDQSIIITRLKKLDVTFEGKTVSYWTDAETYGEFVEKNVIGSDADDIYDVDLSASLKPYGNEMNITKMTYIQEYTYEAIPYTSSTVYDNTVPYGERVVTTAGQNGAKTLAYDVVYRDGVEVSRTFVSETINSEPVNEVITEGIQAINVNGQMVPYKEMITCSATAYDLSFESCGKNPGDPGYGLTASGTYAKLGTVAVDPRVIPLGTKMYIVSTDGRYVYGYCTAEDTGGAIKGNKVDLFYNTRNECLQFGRRNVNVYIL
ncbi:MAG: G5 domain-containing protein [Clostridia bacterium]|nr:G5 domain-containing protein [Clostridia bacterium]